MNAEYTCVSGFRFTPISINEGIGTDMWQDVLHSGSAASESHLSTSPCKSSKFVLLSPKLRVLLLTTNVEKENVRGTSES